MPSNVEMQVGKIFRHVREGSYATRDKYAQVCQDFARHIHDKFRINNLRNVSDKHLVSYVKAMQERGLEAKTIKTNLGAIRFLHSRIDRPRYLELADNKQLADKYGVQLDRVKAVNGDRAWTNQEYERFRAVTQQLATNLREGETAKNVRDCMVLARTMGLRIAEAACVRRSQAESALRTGIYKVGKEAKNGRPRDVPLSPEARRMFEQRLAVTDRGQRLFIRAGDKAHLVINRMEKYMERHREKATTVEGVECRVDLRDGSTRELTWHGLRYSYVQDRMATEIGRGLSWEDAAKIVSLEVGHNRTDVIKIYEGRDGHS